MRTANNAMTQTKLNIASQLDKFLSAMKVSIMNRKLPASWIEKSSVSKTASADAATATADSTCAEDQEPKVYYNLNTGGTTTLHPCK